MSSRDEDVGHFEIPDPVEESTVSLVSSSTSAYASFPVDVVVYVRVQVRAEPVRFTEQVPSSSSEPSSVLLFRVFFPRGHGPCLSVMAWLGGRQALRKFMCNFMCGFLPRRVTEPWVFKIQIPYICGKNNVKVKILFSMLCIEVLGGVYVSI